MTEMAPELRSGTETSTPGSPGGATRNITPPTPGAPIGAPPDPRPDAAAEDTAEPGPEELRPVEIVRRLDDYIIGQASAKRAVAVAMRNRVRRMRIAEEMRHEVLPKNILMIGPTGVGKTEIARRLARLTSSPFLKVEATKFTEVGYVGRDVESIVRDLLEQTVGEVHDDRIAEVEDKAREVAEERIVDSLLEAEDRLAGSVQAAVTPPPPHDAAAAEPMAVDGAAAAAPAPAEPAAEARRQRMRRRRMLRRLRAHQLEDRYVEIEVEEPWQPPVEGFGGTGYEDIGATLGDFFSQLAPPRKRTKRLTVAEARTVLIEEETDRLIDMDRVYDEAIRLVEDSGIVFIDEVDKIAGHHAGGDHGPDVSGEGVQRDLLPILEGSTIHTRYGSVHTEHILFVAAGAFSGTRPSDLIPEFQGRFPIRVELSVLSEADLERILVEPSNALTRQYAALLATEDVALEFTPEGVRALAHAAAQVNEEDENIGARRLFTILETVLEEVSFRAEDHAGQSVVVDAGFVRERLGHIVRDQDLRRFIL